MSASHSFSAEELISITSRALDNDLALSVSKSGWNRSRNLSTISSASCPLKHGKVLSLLVISTRVKNVSKWAFGSKEEEAEATWQDMLTKMDDNQDGRISKDEYSSYWMLKAKSKIAPDGTFVEGYKQFLLKKLVKIKNGNHRQEQVKKWKTDYMPTDEELKQAQQRKVLFQEKVEVVDMECS